MFFFRTCFFNAVWSKTPINEYTWEGLQKRCYQQVFFLCGFFTGLDLWESKGNLRREIKDNVWQNRQLKKTRSLISFAIIFARWEKREERSVVDATCFRGGNLFSIAKQWKNVHGLIDENGYKQPTLSCSLLWRWSGLEQKFLRITSLLYSLISLRKKWAWNAMNYCDSVPMAWQKNLPKILLFHPQIEERSFKVLLSGMYNAKEWLQFHSVFVLSPENCCGFLFCGGYF